MIKKKIVALVIALVFGLLAIAPETFACDRRNARFRGVAGRRYYNDSYYTEPRSRGLGPGARAALTVAAPAAVAAGVGALVGGKKGAGIGALLGGGGGAAYYLINHRRRRF